MSGISEIKITNGYLVGVSIRDQDHAFKILEWLMAYKNRASYHISVSELLLFDFNNHFKSNAPVVFTFFNRHDAMLFKLTYGGKS